MWCLVRDHCHTTGKYRGSTHRDFNIKIEVNHKIPIIFHDLKNYDLHFIMQELGKSDFKIKVIANELNNILIASNF